jgi:hypothetical protein
MSSALDITLFTVYEQMMGVYGLKSSNNNSIIKTNIVSNGFINVNNNSIFNNNLTIRSSLNVLGNVLLGSNTILSNLYVNGLPTLFNTNINSSLYITGNTYVNNNLFANTGIFNNNISLNSNLNVNNNTYISNYTILQNISGINNNLNITAPIINIGSTNSIVYINGTVNYIATNNLQILDKLIILNLNKYSLAGNDSGFNTGIQILGISGNGYLRTNLDCAKYEIQPPLGSYGYILVLDQFNNLNISNKSLLNTTTILTNFYISGNSLFDNCNILTNLNCNNINLNNLYCNSDLNINNNCLFNNVSINSLLNVYNCILNNITINSNLSIKSNSNSILNNITINSSLNVINDSVLNNVSINSSINISNYSLFNNNLSINSSLNINGISLLNKVTINSSLNLSGNCVLVNSVTIGSSLNIMGNTVINSQVTINSSLKILGNLISVLPNFPDNNSAKNGGVPIWGWYRTAGIIKIRLNDIPPIVYISGTTSLSIYSGNNYTDPGAYAYDYINNYNSVYISSILSNTTNLLTNNILITGTTSLVTITSILSSGSYTATYQATDIFGNIGYNYRTLNILNSIISFNMTASNIDVFNYNNNTPYSGSFITNPYTLINLTTGCASIGLSQLANLDITKPWTIMFELKKTTGGDVLYLYFNLIPLGSNSQLTYDNNTYWFNYWPGNNQTFKGVGNSTTYSTNNYSISFDHPTIWKITYTGSALYINSYNGNTGNLEGTDNSLNLTSNIIMTNGRYPLTILTNYNGALMNLYNGILFSYNTNITYSTYRSYYPSIP